MLFSFCCLNPSWLVARGMRWLPLLLILNILTEKRSMFLVSCKVTLSDLGLWDLPWGLVEKRNKGSWAWRQAPIHSSLIGKQKRVQVRAIQFPSGMPLRPWLSVGKSMSLPSHHWIITALGGFQRHSEWGWGQVGPNNGIPAPKEEEEASFISQSTRNTTSSGDTFRLKALPKLKAMEANSYLWCSWPSRGLGYGPTCFSVQQTRTFSPEIRWLPTWGQIPRKTWLLHACGAVMVSDRASLQSGLGSLSTLQQRF